MPTRSPGRKDPPAGARSTRPTIWCPGTRGARSGGRSPSTTWRSVRQIPHARTRTSSSSSPGLGTARSRSRSGDDSMGAWRSSTMARMASAAGALDQLPGAGEVRGVHHLALEAEGVGAARPVLLEEGHQLPRLGHERLVRRERLVDHGDLARVDGDLAAEPHGDAVLALAPEPVEVGDVRVDGVERVDAG